MTKSAPMVKQIGRFVIVALLVLFILGVSQMGVPWRPSSAYAAGPPALAGRVIDSQGEPVHGAEVAAYLNDEEEPAIVGESQPDGVFVLDLPDGDINSLRVEIERPHFEATMWDAEADDLDHLRQGKSLRLPDITLERRLTPGFWIATADLRGHPAAHRPGEAAQRHGRAAGGGGGAGHQLRGRRDPPRSVHLRL